MSFKCRFATLDEAYNNDYYNNDKRSFIDKIKEGQEETDARNRHLEKLRIEKIKREREKKREEAERADKELLDSYISKNGNYWRHPEIKKHKCLIPVTIKLVPSMDTINYITFYIYTSNSWKCLTTLVGVPPHISKLSEEEYLSKYCKCIHDNVYQYIGNKNTDNTDNTDDNTDNIDNTDDNKDNDTNDDKDTTDSIDDNNWIVLE